MLKINKHFQAILLGVFVLVISGCTTVHVVHTEKVPDFLLSNYNSYDFYQVEVDSSVLPEFLKRVEWIKDELSVQLENKGLIKSAENPELLVNIGIALTEKTQTRETDYVSDATRYMVGMNYAWQSETVEVGKYLSGTFVLHFVDASDNILVWEGIAQGAIVEKEEKSKKNIEVAARELFKKIK